LPLTIATALAAAVTVMTALPDAPSLVALIVA
jgi:hypothetical protein